MLQSPLPAPTVREIAGDSLGALAAATAGGDPVPWLGVVAIVGVGLVLLAGTTAVMVAVRRRAAPDDPARRRATRTDRLERPLDAEITATLDRRAARQAGARQADQEG